MTNTAKLSKVQLANLNRIWKHRTAAGLVHVDRTYRTAIDGKTCIATGFDKMHANAAHSLISKGLVRMLTTTVTHTSKYGTYRVQVLVLTDAGRAAIGV